MAVWHTRQIIPTAVGLAGLQVMISYPVDLQWQRLKKKVMFSVKGWLSMHTHETWCCYDAACVSSDVCPFQLLHSAEYSHEQYESNNSIDL